MLRFVLAVAFMVLAVVPAHAQRSPVVVELFTSQGCSSCPPADALLHELAARDDVIALALHVDYWDYIGWKDEFADPRNAERQRAYARLGQRRSVYTPEFIVNGQSEIVGAKGLAVLEAVMRHKDMPRKVALSMTRDGDALSIEAQLLTDRAGPMEVHMLQYQERREARISRGENAGRQFNYANVTENWNVLGTWDGAAPLALEVEVPGTLPTVVLIQEAGAGKILAAAQAR